MYVTIVTQQPGTLSQSPTWKAGTEAVRLSAIASQVAFIGNSIGSRVAGTPKPCSK